MGVRSAILCRQRQQRLNARPVGPSLASLEYSEVHDQRYVTVGTVYSRYE